MTLELWESTGGLQKQVVVRAWDERVLDLDARRRAGATHALLHPQLMYRLFRNVWQGALPLRDFLDRAVHRPWLAPGRRRSSRRRCPTSSPPSASTSATRSPTRPANRALVQRRRRAARRRAGPVVLLNTGVVVDEHLDAEPRGRPRTSCGRWPASPPARNLAAQSAVLARARLFVGTYGGLAHLAPFYGVPDDRLRERPGRDQPGASHARAAAPRRVYGASLAVVDRDGFELLDAIAAQPAAVR